MRRSMRYPLRLSGDSFDPPIGGICNYGRVNEFAIKRDKRFSIYLKKIKK